MKKLKILFYSLFYITVLTGCGKEQKQLSEEQAESIIFQPQMDASENITLHIVGYMESFDALDLIAEDFQKYYPNCKIQYNYLEDYQNSLEKRIIEQENIDIFTVYPQYFQKSAIIADNAENLYEANINLSNIETVVLKNCFYNKNLKEIPLALNTCILVVNNSLLEKEGLFVPTNQGQFINVCEQLVEQGYIPIQGNATPVYFSMMRSEYVVRLGKSENASSIFAALNQGMEGSSEYLRENFELLTNFIDRGYIDPILIDSYEDNYKQAALRFFEGNVPFLVTNLDTFSSMKKWERDSTTFSNAKFEYNFAYLPFGEKNICAYVDAWTGFSVYENSANKEWANEFLRFFMTVEELNRFANAKGMPTISIDNKEDKRFRDLFEQREENIVYHGEIAISEELNQVYKSTIKQLGKGKLTVEEALEHVERELGKKQDKHIDIN